MSGTAGSPAKGSSLRMTATTGTSASDTDRSDRRTTADQQEALQLARIDLRRHVHILASRPAAGRAAR
jgi:hypothetical protein